MSSAFNPRTSRVLMSAAAGWFSISAAWVVLGCGDSGQSLLPPARGGGSGSGAAPSGGTRVGNAGMGPGGQAASGGGSTASGGSSFPSAGSPGSTPTTGGAAPRGGATGNVTGGATGSGGSGTTTGGSPSGGSTSTGGGGTAMGGSAAAQGGGGPGTGGIKATGGTSSATGGGAIGGTKATGGGATGGGATGGGATGGDGLLVPATGALLGVFTPAQSQAEIATKETQIGRKFAIHLGYFDWSLDYTAFAGADIAAGRIPYVTVEPWNVTLAAIASGAQDTIIQSRATGIKALTGKVMLRFAHEMNGNWYPWDGTHNGANAAATAAYVAAYRHIKDVFVAAGVTNVLWVFCPNVNSVPNDAWNQWANYYPGDTYVDWMCFDGYDWGGGTFTALTSTIYSQFVAANNKPIMLGETSTPEVEKAVWINGILPAMQSQFPMLKALVWFDVNIGTANNYLYDSSAGSLAAFISMANDPYFNP